MTDNYLDWTRALFNLLNKLPAKPRIAFRGYVDRAVDRVQVVGSPTLATTTHSLEIATNNLARPEVAIAVDADEHNLISILRGASNFNLQGVTYPPSSCFLQHVAHKYNGMTIQVYEEIVLNSQPTGSMITHPLHTWDSILTVFDPVLRAAQECPLPIPEDSSDRFLEPIH